jgi:hypothetical protein
MFCTPCFKVFMVWGLRVRAWGAGLRFIGFRVLGLAGFMV